MFFPSQRLDHSEKSIYSSNSESIHLNLFRQGLMKGLLFLAILNLNLLGALHEYKAQRFPSQSFDITGLPPGKKA